MNMRPLIVDNRSRAAVAAVLAFASRPENHYVPGRSETAPGDIPQHCAQIAVGFRCVFSMTAYRGKLFRHLSVSVTGDKLPSSEAVAEIAHLFGFIGGS